jgi:hypothetical protein
MFENMIIKSIKELRDYKGKISDKLGTVSVSLVHNKGGVPFDYIDDDDKEKENYLFSFYIYLNDRTNEIEAREDYSEKEKEEFFSFENEEERLKCLKEFDEETEEMKEELEYNLEGLEYDVLCFEEELNEKINNLKNQRK